MRLVFFGTPDVAVLALRTLLASRHEVVAVVTQPDRPRGRGRKPSPPPVKEVAEAHGIPVLQPESPKDEGFAERLRSFRPGALGVVAYGHILPVAVLEVAPAINIHFSLLPRYRGAAPVQRALMDRATETGISAFLLEPTLDTGPVVLAERVEVGPEETAGELLARLGPIGARMLVEALDGFEAGSLRPVAQDSSYASPAPKIKPEEARIDWAAPADRIVNLVRALNPEPGAWTTFRGKRMTVWRARVTDAPSGAPGEIIPMAKERFVVAAGSGAVEPLELQPEGKRRMSAEEFARGYRPGPEDRLGA